MPESGITMSRDPIDLINKTMEAFTPTEGDLLYAGNMQKTRILDRTERGVDVNEQAFAPYKDSGPFYWYPEQGLKNRGASRDRFLRKINAVANDAYNSGEGWGKGGRLDAASGARKTLVRERDKSTGAIEVRAGIGVRFANYAAAKVAITGSSVVNLMGFRAPHMLQAIIVKVQDGLLTIGIYGDEAARADGNNKKRHFFGASAADKTLMVEELYERGRARVAAAIQGWATRRANNP